MSQTARYSLDLEAAPDPALRLPISSWQATLRHTRPSYVQCVVPAAIALVDAVMARFEADARLVIVRHGSTETPVLSVPLDPPQYHRGPQRATLTLSGYEDHTFADTSTYLMQGMRLLSLTPTTRRVRAPLDDSVRPGMVAQAPDWAFVIDWINFYASSRDRYMDFGEQS